MRRAAVAVLLGIALGASCMALPQAAAGQGVFVYADPQTKLTDITLANLKVKGAVTAEFHGDRGAGCAAMGVCGLSGTVTWDVAGPGQLLAIGFVRDTVKFEEGFAVLGTGDPFSSTGPLTSAHVRRAADGAAPEGLCSDAASVEGTFLDIPAQRGSSVSIAFSGVSGIDPLRTRCAGPSAIDVVGLLPVRRLTARAIGRGHRTLDFAVEREFAIHGFAGTLRSDVAIRLGTARQVDPRLVSGISEPSGRTRRRRELIASYRIEQVTGEVNTDVAGLADPDLCGPLDSCGVLGTVRLAPRAASGEAFLQAIAPATRSANDLRRALGLSPGPAPPGISASGYGLWDDQGSVTSSLVRAGAQDCTDSGPIPGGGAVLLEFTERGVRASYGDPGTTGFDALRTRCPGPGASDVARSRPLASGTMPLRAFRRRTVTLRLTEGGGFSSDGYSGRTHPDVTVVLRRIGVRSRLFDEPLSEQFRRALRRSACCSSTDAGFPLASQRRGSGN